MKSLVVVVAVLVLAAIATVQAKCKGGCGVPVAQYKDMGCKPVFAKPEDCCPSHYTCAKFEGRAADKCYVQGNVYNQGEWIDGNITQANCYAFCVCSKNEWPVIICAIAECGGNLLGPGCYRAYDLDFCCPSKTLCPPFDRLAKCEVGGKTYKEGETFYPEKTNLQCVCKPNFKGKLEAPFCSEIRCGIELVHTQDIKNKCAPVYYETHETCPIRWKCLEEGDVVVPNLKGTTSEQKCSYGDKTLNVGDKLIFKQSPNRPKIDCECKIPPLITCTQKPRNS